MKLKTVNRSVQAAPGGIDFARKVVASLPGEKFEEKLVVIAKNFGYHVNHKFDGVEVSGAYHDFVSVGKDDDQRHAAPLMRALLTKVELGQALAPSEVEFANAPILTLSLLDTSDEFCFALVDLLAHKGTTWVALNCVELENGHSEPMKLLFQWL